MAYVATVTKDIPRVERISRNLGIMVGKCDITTYHQTGAEITDITNYFKTVLRVICDGMSDNGYVIRWNTTDKCFHAFYPVTAHSHPFKIATEATPTVAMAFDGGVIEASTGGTVAEDTSTSGVQDCTSQLAVEVASDSVDVGEVNFIAIGLLH